jgi:hypothetical protein
MLSLSYYLVAHGWSKAVVSDETSSVTLTASYQSDALRELTDAAIALLRGDEHALCVWLEEPGEYRWHFNRFENNVQITIVWFDDWAEYRDDHDHGKVIFLTRCHRRHLARQILGQLRRVLGDVGDDGYKERWGAHNFPMDSYRSLEGLVSAASSTSTGSGGSMRRPRERIIPGGP